MVLTSAEREVIRRDTDERIRLALQKLEIAPPVSDDGSIQIKQVDVMAFMLTAVYDPGGLIEQLVGVSASQALSNKTLLSPVVESFELANHSHVDAQGAGQLTSAAIPTALTIDRQDEISLLTAKASPAVKDLVVIESVSDGFAKRKVELGDLPSAGGGDSLPVVDTKSIVEDTGDPTREMRIDVGAVANSTVRVLFMPDEDIDLTPGGTGTYPARIHDHEAAAGGGTLGSLAIPSAFTNDVVGQIASLAQKVTPLGADHVLIESAADGNAKRRVLISDFPAGSEVNDLETSTFGIGADELVMGSGGSVSTYAKISALSEEPTPATGDWVLGENLAGNLVKMDPDNIGGGGSSPPFADSTSIVTFGTDKEMRIDVGAVTDSTVRVLTMPDADIDLTPGTGSFATEAEGTLAASAMQDLSDDSTPTLSGPLDMGGNGIYATGGSVELLTFTEGGGATNHVNIANSFGSPTISVVGDSTDIDLQFATKGTGRIQFTDEINSTADILMSGAASIGTGGLIRTGSPTIVTPTIASLENAQHDHSDAAGGGALGAGSIAHTALADFVPESILLRESGTGAPSDSIFTDIAIPGTAGAADWVMGWTAAGLIARWDADDFLSGGSSPPFADSQPIVTFGTDQEMRIDVGAVAASTLRVLTMPNQDIDLTPGTGSFATEAEGTLAASAVQDGGDLSAGSVAHSALANFPAESILLREAGSGAPTASIFTDLTSASPAGADFILGFLSTGEIRKYAVTDLPAGGEVNALQADGAVGIGDNQLPVGTGAGTVSYRTVPTAVALEFDGTDFVQTDLAGLSDVTAKTGTGTVVVMDTSPTIATPFIASFLNAGHDHSDAAGGSIIDAVDLADFKANSILLNDGVGSAAPQVADELDLATLSPLGADFLLGWTAAGLLRKFNVSGLPAGSEVNDLVTDGAAGIEIDEVFVGTGTDAGAYVNTTGSGTVVRSGSPTITTPRIVTTGSIQDGGGDAYLTFVEVATPVVSLQITQGLTTAPALITAIGEANAGMRLSGAGSGTVEIITPEIGASAWLNAQHAHSSAGTGGTIAIADTTGTLGETRGGTDQTTYAQGDLLHSTSSNQLGKLAIGAAHQHFRTNGAGTLPEWYDKEERMVFTLESPVIGDIFGFDLTNKAITVTEVQAICDNGTTAVCNIRRHTSIAAAGGTLIDQVTPGTTLLSDTSITAPSVPADVVVFVEMGTITGSVDSVTVKVYYTED